MHHRRLRRAPAALEITAFLNLIVVLVPFLLSTAVFTRYAVLQLGLPPAAAPGLEHLSVRQLQLEVLLRADGLEVADRLGGLIGRVPQRDGSDDLGALAALLQQLKARFPDERRASVLAEPGTRYERLVQVMGAVRATPDAAALFPQLVLGDAPQRGGLRAGGGTP